jgi:hypothetical protein
MESFGFILLDNFLSALFCNALWLITLIAVTGLCNALRLATPICGERSPHVNRLFESCVRRWSARLFLCGIALNFPYYTLLVYQTEIVILQTRLRIGKVLEQAVQ